jgi:hypothetical protein
LSSCHLPAGVKLYTCNEAAQQPMFCIPVKQAGLGVQPANQQQGQTQGVPCGCQEFEQVRSVLHAAWGMTSAWCSREVTNLCPHCAQQNIRVC